MSAVQPLRARQTTTIVDGEEFFDGRPVPYWYTREGQIIRWSIFFGIFIFFLLFMIIGYWHAKRRIRKGLAPLAYHRWLLNRETRIRYDPSYNPPTMYYQEYPQPGYGQYGYGMQPMPMPPPMYDPNAPLPPTYQPPAGGSKVDPSQYRTQPTRRPAESGDGAPSYEPPAGPPPAALRPDNTGASAVSNNPYRL